MNELFLSECFCVEYGRVLDLMEDHKMNNGKKLVTALAGTKEEK